MDTVTFHANDGCELHADLYRPEGAARCGVLLAPAMGVSRAYYRAFAEHLAAHGHLVLVAGYRGMDGRVRRGGGAVALHQWGELDLPAATRHLQAEAAGKPLVFVGHSVGGQLLGLMPNVPFGRALMVASQSGYWRHWSGARRAAMFGLWHGILPALVGITGKLPMKALGQGDDVPAGVALEWARWGRHPDYIGMHAASRGGASFAEWDGVLRQVALADDGYAPVAAVEALGRLYVRARRDLQVIHPHQVGAKRVGHFGYFRRSAAETLWPGAVAFLAGETVEAARAA